MQEIKNLANDRNNIQSCIHEYRIYSFLLLYGCSQAGITTFLSTAATVSKNVTLGIKYRNKIYPFSRSFLTYK